MPGQDDETIIVRAILRDELSEPANRINDSLSDMGDTMDDTADRTDNLTDAERRNAEQSEKTTRQIQAENQQRDQRGRFIRNETEETERNTKTQKTNTRERSKSTKAASKQLKVFGKLSGLFMQFAKVGTLLDAASMAATGIGALGTAAAVAGSGIATLSGSLLAVPGLLGGAVQTALVGKIAFSGLGGAISSLAGGDYSKFADATKDMAPNMVNAAKAMGELGQKWKPVTKDIQNKVWEGLGTQLTEIGNKALPIVQKSFMSTAGSINTAMKGVLGFVNSKKGMSQFATIMDTNAKISGQFTNSVQHGLIGMMGVMAAASPAAVRLGQALSGAFVNMADKIQENQTGIANFANRGVTALLGLGRVIANISVGLYNIFKGASGMAAQFGTSIENLTKKFRDWTASTEGQAKIKEYFESMKPIFVALGGLAKALVTAFGQIGNTPGLADLINKLTEMVPIFTELINQASGRFIPALLDIAGSLSQVVLDSNGLHVTAALLKAAAWAAQTLADIFGALPGPIQTVIGTSIALGIAMKAAAASSIGSWLLQRSVVQAWGKYFGLVIKSQIANLRAFMAAQWAAAKPGIMSKMGAAWAGVTRGIKAAALAVRAFSMSLMSFLFTNPIGWIILAVIALVAVFVILWKKCEGFRNLVKAIGQWFVNVWNGTLYPTIMKVWDWMKSVWDRVYNFIKGVVMGIVNWFRSNWDTIKAVAMVVFNVLKAIVRGYMLYVKIVFTVIKFVVMLVWNAIKIYVTTVFKIISAVVRVFGPIVISVFKLIWQVIRIVWNSIRLVVFIVIQAIILYVKMLIAVWTVIWNVAKTVVLAIWNALLTYWRFMWNIIKSVFMVVWNAILAVIRFLTPIVQGVINFVVGVFTAGWNFVKTVVQIAISIIGSIIGTIVGIAQNVINFVVSVWNAGWNAIAPIVTGVINTIRGVISGIGSFVSGVVNTIKNAFTSAFNAISSVVMPILNAIKSAIDNIVSAAKSIGDAIGGAADALNPFNFAGGPITAGTKSWVGELGPEAFVTHTGKVEMIGQHGMELMNFNRPGYIVPNHVLRGYNDPSVPGNVMSKLAGAMSAPEPTLGTYQTNTARENLSSNTYMQDKQGGGNHYDFRGANFGGDPAATKKAVKDALNEIERNKKERG